MDSKNYDILSDYLSDHLWMSNSLDFEFLKQFPEFFYKGIAYRVIFSNDKPELRSFENQSFTKSLDGVKEYIENATTYDKEFTAGKTPFVYQCLIEGFDVNAALLFFKKNHGLTEKTVSSFIQEDEVIAFTFSNLTSIKLT